MYIYINEKQMVAVDSPRGKKFIADQKKAKAPAAKPKASAKPKAEPKSEE